MNTHNKNIDLKLIFTFSKIINAHVLLILIIISFYSCSGSKQTNYDYQKSWTNFKIVNIHVSENVRIQNILTEIGIKNLPEYIDITVDVFSNNQNDRYLYLDDLRKPYLWNVLDKRDQNYLLNWTGSNKVKLK